MEYKMNHKYSIRCNHKEIFLECIDDVIRELNKMKMQSNQEQSFLVIEMTNKWINVVFVKEGKCSLLITPKDSKEDSKITYNKLLDPEERYTKLNVKTKYSFSFTQYNLINYDDGMSELRKILENNQLSLAWHSY